MGYYDTLARKYGDHERCKKRYKARRIIKAVAWIGAVPTIEFIIILLKYADTSLPLMVGGVLLLVWAGIGFYCLKVNQQPVSTIHTKPDLSNVDLQGGELFENEDNGREVFTIQYRASRLFIVGDYYDDRYHLSIQEKSASFRQPSKIVHTFPPAVQEELSSVLAQAAACAAGLIKGDSEGEKQLTGKGDIQ